MTRNLKVLGLALVAIFAMSALVAASASAKYDSEVEKTTLTGSNTEAPFGTSNHTFTTNAGTVTCKMATFSGTSSGTAVEGGFTTNTLRVHPVYNECNAFGFPANVNTEGCDYEFGTPTALSAHVNVVCTGTSKIKITAIGFCVMEVGGQNTTTGTAMFTNTGSGSTRDVDVESKVESIIYNGTCGSGNNGSYRGLTTVKGYKDGTEHNATNQVGIWVTN